MPGLRRGFTHEKKDICMNFWTESFCDVCHIALLYAQTLQIARDTFKRNPCVYSWQEETARLKARLEAACAIYRVMRAQEFKGVS